MEENQIQSKAEDPGQGYTRVYLVLLAAIVLLALFFAFSRSLSLLGEFTPPDSVDWLFLLLALVCNLLFWLVASMAWQITIWRICEHKIKLLYSFAQIALVLVGKYIPGKVWGLAIRGKDLTRQGVSNYQAVICSQVEQLISIHAGITIGLAGWLLYEKPVYWQIFITILLVIPLLGSILNNFFVGKIVQLVSRFIRSVNFSEHEISFSTYIVLFVMYILEWLVIGGILYCLWMAVFLPGFDLITTTQIISVNALAFVLGFLAVFAPGGIGVREGVLVALLTATMGLTQAIYISVLFRIWLIFTDAIAGLLSLKIISDDQKANP